MNTLCTAVIAACSDMDDAECIVSECLDDILQKSLDILFDKHISSQVLPYAVQFAKDAVLHLVMSEFFDQDHVDPLDPLWRPDLEPDQLPPDSWSRGTLANDWLTATPADSVKPVVEWNKAL